MKVAHSGDQHFNPDKMDRCRTAQEQMISDMTKVAPELHLMAGDWFDYPQMLAENDSAVNYSLDVFKRYADICPIVMVKGNNEHDGPGSLNVFKTMKTKHPVYVSDERAESVLYLASVIGHFSTNIDLIKEATCLIHTFPYPNKSWFLANQQENLSIDETNRAIEHAIQKIFMGMAILSDEAHRHGIPVVFVGHGNLLGMTKGNGQRLLGQDIILNPASVKTVGADFYGWGHIHDPQEVNGHWYCGSSYHKDTGETKPKTWILANIEQGVDGIDTTIFHWPIPSRPMLRYELEYEDGKYVHKTRREYDEWNEADVYINVHCTKEQSKHITDDEVKTLFLGAHSYKIKKVIKPDERLRAANIGQATTLREKLGEWGTATDQVIKATVFDMADQVEGRTR